MRYPEHRLNEIGFRARLYDLNHIPLEKGIAGMIKRVPKVVPYDNDARDADGDGLVQEGTIWERPAGTRWVSKLGSALSSGLRAIPGNSKIVDKDGNDVDYKPGDKAQGGRAKLRGLLARRRLRRAGRRRRRAEGRREEDAERTTPETYDKLIETLENAANAASQERLIEAEKARGDEPMDGAYRSFWDTFMEAFTGMSGGKEQNSRDKSRSKAALRKAAQMEGNRRTAGDENGNAPDSDREKEFDEEALDGKGVMPSAIEEHHRKLREDPEYRKRWNRALREGRIDQFIEKEGLRPQLVDPDDRRPGGGLKPPPGGWEPESSDRRPRPPRPSPVPEDRDVPEPKMDEVDAPEADAPEADSPRLSVDEIREIAKENPYDPRHAAAAEHLLSLEEWDDDMYAEADMLMGHMLPPDGDDDLYARLRRRVFEEREGRPEGRDAPEDDVRVIPIPPETPEADVPETDADGSFIINPSIEHYRDVMLPDMSDEELARYLAIYRDALAGDDAARNAEFPDGDGAERFALTLQEQRRRLIASRGEGEEEPPDPSPADDPMGGRPWNDAELDGATDEAIAARLTRLVAGDPLGDNAEIAAEVERLRREQRTRWEEENLPGDAFFDNDSWIEGDFAWDDDAIDATINVALATDDMRTIEGIERSLQMYKDDLTASEWRGEKGRRYREIQAILDRRRAERNVATRTEPPEDRDAPEADASEAEDHFGGRNNDIVDLSDEEIQEQINDLEDIEDRTLEQQARLDALGDEYDERFGTEEEQDQAREDTDLEERLEWYETDPETLSDEELQTEINELNSEEDLDEHAMEWLTKLSNEDDRRQEARDEESEREAAEAETAEEARRAELIEEQRDPRDMTPEEMAEEMDAITSADDDELAEHWGSPDAALDRHNALQDGLDDREERDAAHAEREEQEDPTGMAEEDIGEEMSELFDITQDEDYSPEAQKEAQDRWNLLSAELDRRERETEQHERELSEALDEQQAHEDAEEARIREAEEQAAEAAEEAAVAREAEIEADERQVRVDEHENNPPDSLSEEDLANEIAELSDSEIMDDLDTARLNDLETEVERRMEAAATREDSNRGERKRSLRGRSKESLQEELDELMEDPDANEKRLDALETELDRREKVRNRDGRERTRERTDELEEAEEREFEGEGEDDEDLALPESDFVDSGEDDEAVDADEDRVNPYASEPDRPTTTPPEEPETIPPADTRPEIAAWREEHGDPDPQFADMTWDEIEEELYTHTNRALTPEDIERAMALSEELSRRKAHPDHEGGSGPNGEWTDADEAADPAGDPYAELEDFLRALDADIYDGMTAVYDNEEDAKAAQEVMLGKLIRRDELLENDFIHRGGEISTHREMMRHKSDAEILALLGDEEYWDPEWADEHGVTKDAFYDNNQKYLNALAEAEKRGLLVDTAEPTNAERATPNDPPEADLPDPLEGKTPEVAEAEEAIRRDWDSYSPEVKEYLVHSFLDARLRETRAELVADYRRRGEATIPDLPKNASPAEKAIHAKQLEIAEKKLAVYEVIADRVMSGGLEGTIEASDPDPTATVHGFPLHSLLQHRTLADVDKHDIKLHLEALGHFGDPPATLFGTSILNADGQLMYDIPNVYIETILERNGIVGTPTTDAQLKEAVAELGLLTSGPDGLGEILQAELVRLLETRGEGDYEGSADALFKDVLTDVEEHGSIRRMQNRRNWREAVDEHWVTVGKGIKSAFQGRNNLKRALKVQGDGAIEDLGLTGLIPHAFGSGWTHNIDSLTKSITSAWLIQLRNGEIDEATFVSNVKNLPHDLRRSFKKHAAAARAEGRGGTDARRASADLDAWGIELESDGSIHVFQTAVDFAMIGHHDYIKDLAVDGIIDVAVPQTDEEIVRGLLRSVRTITNTARQSLAVDENGKSKKLWPMSSRERSPVTGQMRLLPTRTLSVEEQILRQRSLDEATDALFPDDWILVSNEAGEVSLVANASKRASYGDSTGLLLLNRDLPDGIEQIREMGDRPVGSGQIDVSTHGGFDVPTAGHEMVHRIQSINPLLLLLDEDLARKLTTPGPDDDPTDAIWQLTSLGDIFNQEEMADEFGIPDHLSMPYMGKGYSSRHGDLRWEVSSVGVELLLGGSIEASARGVANSGLGVYTLADALAEGRSSSFIGHVLAMLAII